MALCVKVPGSGGELLQGTIDGEPFLVTCPINVYTKAIVSNERCIDLPPRALVALEETLHFFKQQTFFYGIRLQSALPQGKGMSSSSADIAATCQAAAIALGNRLTEENVASIAVSVEPTDGVFCEGIVRFNHINGKILEKWREVPTLVFVLFDLGGAIDTLYFNRRLDLHRLNVQKEPQIKEALRILQIGLAGGDLGAIGRAATISAFANQAILYKPQLDTIYKIARRCGAFGINIAHSGTLVGMLFAADQANDMKKSIRMMKENYPEITFLRIAQLISGGFEIEDGLHDGTF